jgi:hypothetical protein
MVEGTCCADCLALDHWPCAFRAASTMCARANSVATAAAVSGKRFGSMIDGAVGQTIRTFAGIASGSTSSFDLKKSRRVER